MATIELSSALVASAATGGNQWQYCMSHRVFGYGYTTNNNPSISSPAGAVANMRPIFDSPNANRAVGQLHIMKGTVPTDFSSLVDFSSRSADILITYSTTNGTTGDFVLDPTNQAVPYTYGLDTAISTNYVAALAAGQATWFWLMSRAATSTTVFSNTLYHQIVGTVGLIGSGTDLQIPDPTIVAGKLYKISGLKLTIPTLYTY